MPKNFPFLLHQMLSPFSTINLVFQRYYYPVLVQDLLKRIGIISDAVWCTWKKSVMRIQNTAFKNCNKWTNGLLKIKLYILNKAHTPVEKQSNQDWNTPIHLKSNSPHIKVPLIFWFLSWFSAYVFITNCGLNGYV